MKSYDDNVEPGYNAELERHNEFAERAIAAGKLRRDINEKRSSTGRIIAVVVFFVLALYFLILFFL